MESKLQMSSSDVNFDPCFIDSSNLTIKQEEEVKHELMHEKLLKQEEIFVENKRLIEIGSAYKNTFFEHVDEMLESGFTDLYGKDPLFMLEFTKQPEHESSLGDSS